MSKENVMEEQKIWGLLVHGVVAPVAFKERDEAVGAIKAWKSRGWEFVSVVKLEESE
jgi:hypothetical protein